MSTPDHSTVGWAVRAQQACDWVFWIMAVNLAWLAFTLLGGVVLGAAPATLAAVALTRRRLRGEVFGFVGAFAAAWRREFWRANALLAPVAGVAGLLTWNLVSFQAMPGGEIAAAASAVALALVLVVGMVAVPMYTHYELPIRHCLITAWRYTCANLAPALLLALVATLIIGASAVLPGLLPFVTVGALITADTALCLSFFAANDRRLAEQAQSR